MLLRHLEGLIDTFSNSNTGNNNNELAPTVVIVQLIHRLDISVCFTDASFHLDGKVESTLQLGRRCNQVCSLNLLYMFQNQTVIQLRNQFRIRPTSEVIIVSKRLLIPQTSVHHVRRSQIGLTCKNINHSFRSI